MSKIKIDFRAESTSLLPPNRIATIVSWSINKSQTNHFVLHAPVEDLFDSVKLIFKSVLLSNTINLS